MHMQTKATHLPFILYPRGKHKGRCSLFIVGVDRKLQGPWRPVVLAGCFVFVAAWDNDWPKRFKSQTKQEHIKTPSPSSLPFPPPFFEMSSLCLCIEGTKVVGSIHFSTDVGLWRLFILSRLKCQKILQLCASGLPGIYKIYSWWTENRPRWTCTKDLQVY